MKNTAMRIRLVLGAILGALAITGCVSWDVSAKYNGIVGSEYTTNEELTLWLMHEHQYRFLPYHLSNSSYDGVAARIQTIPAGARIKVVAAKRDTSLDAGFDYLIADIFPSRDSAPIHFEEMMQDAGGSVSPAWTKTK